MVRKKDKNNRLGTEEIVETQRNGKRTLGDKMSWNRLYFESHNAEYLSATKQSKEETGDLASKQNWCRETLEAAL